MKIIRAVKRTLLSAAKAIGYEVRKVGGKDELNLYHELYSANSVINRRFYNIGAGSFSHPYWTNIDYENEWYKQNNHLLTRGIHHDLFSGIQIPVPDESAEIIYTSHTIEHLTDDAARRLFAESYRMLKPGGLLRVTAPDIELAFDAYQRRDRHFFRWERDYSQPDVMRAMAISSPLTSASTEQLFIYHVASAVSDLHADSSCAKVSDTEFRDLLNTKGFTRAMDDLTGRCTIEVQRKYVGNHINWWCHSKLERFLRIAGFRRVMPSQYLQSQAAVLRNQDLFDFTVPSVSFYTEAIKE